MNLHKKTVMQIVAGEQNEHFPAADIDDLIRMRLNQSVVLMSEGDVYLFRVGTPPGMKEIFFYQNSFVYVYFAHIN